jgi:hypothetical protein
MTATRTLRTPRAAIPSWAEKVVNAKHYYLAGGQAFGPFISRNLTPDGPKGLPAERTFAEFKQIIRTGVDLEHLHPQISPLLQVMPWPPPTRR